MPRSSADSPPPISCLVCGTADHLYHKRQHRVFRCRDCGLGVVDPLPSAEELERFYANAYYKSDHEWGYHTEYGSIKFALFFLAEYINMITASALVVVLFFGGYTLPFVELGDGLGSIVLSGFIFAAKVFFFLFLYIWVRWTLPRFRYDQLMDLGWKVMLPVSLVLIVVTAGVQAFVFSG